MAENEYYRGRRLSLKGQLCTVRYIGPVAEKPGTWLGVEWDDPNRGKHNGTHNNVPYFKCRSTSPTCASFLRPGQPWDKPRCFVEALREKYMASDVPDVDDAIQISRSKQAEEVGFSKFAARQAELRGIHNIVLDRMCIQHRIGDPDNDAIGELCSGVTDLDIGSNLIDSVLEVCDLISRFPKLRSLNLNGLRFSSNFGAELEEIGFQDRFKRLRSLSLSNTLLEPEEVSRLVWRLFGSLETLVACNEEWSEFPPAPNGTLPETVKTTDLSNNEFETIGDVGGLFGRTTNASQAVEKLILRNCRISSVHSTGGSGISSRVDLGKCHAVKELDLRHNAIASWSFFNDLASTFPNLKHLRTADNPLYLSLTSVDGKPLTAEDGYMLTIARLAGLETLNYSKITDKERLNAETYYLSQIAAELSKTGSVAEAEKVKARNPRWAVLCEEYGEPAVTSNNDKEGQTDPNSLAARLVTVSFSFEGKLWEKELPKSFNIYEVLGIVGKEIGIMPLELRLIWETGELDSVGDHDVVGFEGPTWWDSSDDEVDGIDNGSNGRGVEREVELVVGTRPLGTYLEGAKATVRVERRRRYTSPNISGR